MNDATTKDFSTPSGQNSEWRLEDFEGNYCVGGRRKVTEEPIRRRARLREWLSRKMVTTTRMYRWCVAIDYRRSYMKTKLSCQIVRNGTIAGRRRSLKFYPETELHFGMAAWFGYQIWWEPDSESKPLIFSSRVIVNIALSRLVLEICCRNQDNFGSNWQ